MNRLAPSFCGIGFDSKAVVVGNLIENNYGGFVGPTITDKWAVEPPLHTFEIAGEDGEECVSPDTLAIHLPDLPDGCFVALNQSGMCGSMWVESDSSGIIINALRYHDGGIKSKVVYSSFHPEGYTNNLEKYEAYTASELSKKTFYGQYTGNKSVKDLLAQLEQCENAS